MNRATSHPIGLGNGVRKLGSRFDYRPRRLDSGSLPATKPESFAGEDDGVRTTPTRIARWKRVLDLTCILLGLPAILTVMMFVALWVKIVSPGPLFFRQRRVGYLGRYFSLWKFRSMRVNVETQTHERYLEWLIQADCPMAKLDVSGDPRLIYGGRVLRALGLDELPQILNVIRGEMSLVGPRPCTPHEFERYEARHRKRVLAPPGLTGYWQVNGKNSVTFSEMIEMDIFYAHNMSPWLDLTIMLKTVPTLVMQQVRSRSGRKSENRANARWSGP